jgi:hypothetical protein
MFILCHWLFRRSCTYVLVAQRVIDFCNFICYIETLVSPFCFKLCTVWKISVGALDVCGRV